MTVWDRRERDNRTTQSDVLLRIGEPMVSWWPRGYEKLNRGTSSSSYNHLESRPWTGRERPESIESTPDWKRPPQGWLCPGQEMHTVEAGNKKGCVNVYCIFREEEKSTRRVQNLEQVLRSEITPKVLTEVPYWSETEKGGICEQIQNPLECGQLADRTLENQ